ncbi:MAG: Na+/H+ antiporter NhaA [Flavipsychrobacter sp.]
MRLTKLFNDFFESEKSGGVVLLVCAVISIFLANSAFQADYISFWKLNFAGHHLDHWINDGLMTIFFLLIGLELEREIYAGELSDMKNAMLPIFAALGGMVVPAGIHLLLNYGTPGQSGAGIPMATDIAFALGVLALLGKRVPISLKIFLTALAVIDDLGAILTIAIFYSKGISFLHLGIALGIFAVLGILNRMKVRNLIPYLIGGVAMWYFMLHSGVHATISGVLLAFVIPFGNGDEKSTSYRLQHFLHKPVSFIILPIFALANTAIIFEGSISDSLSTSNSLGIIMGLFLGKPIGILLFSFVAVAIGICSKPDELKWKHIIGLGLLGGIGFTMSIFVTLLAFDDTHMIDASKIAIIVASAASALAGLLLLSLTLPEKSLHLANA